MSPSLGHERAPCSQSTPISHSLGARGEVGGLRMLELARVSLSSPQHGPLPPLLQHWEAQVCSRLARPDHGPHSSTYPPLRALILSPDTPPGER